MAKFRPPESFDFSHPESLPEWKPLFTCHRIAGKLNKEDEDVQVCTVIYALQIETEQIYKTLVFGEGEDETYEKVMEKFDNYFVPKVNAILERARFHLRSQKPGKTAGEYIRSLHELADTCDFGLAKDGKKRWPQT